ncbi:pericentrin isoform X3 [Nerophis ophidion]|uniref:pericentrin isoform X3 n=1 Tax=Nerophis ophidion TaxID=159077 RepID=UPI002AE06655|nr:pericentrin isoform X3 [Nerophis ophidion]
MDEDERQRKLEAGRAKKSFNMPQRQLLASFRQRRAKSSGAGAAKKTAKRKGQAVSQDDGATQDPSIEPTLLLPADGKKTDENSVHEEAPSPNNAKVQPLSAEPSFSPVDELGDKELFVLTSNEELQQLKQAVEKRNEIIAKLSSNLQKDLSSRDEVQLEVQSLTGQIQALQKQLQQTSVGFLRLKNQPRGEVSHEKQQHGSQNEDLSLEDISMEQSASEGLCFQTGAEGLLGTHSEIETENVLHELRARLQEEKEKTFRASAELEQERANHQHVISLLEEQKRGWEEECNKREVQLQQAKEEKEVLNREVLELRNRLEQENKAVRRLGEEETKFTLRLQSLEDERLRQEEEMRKLEEEMKKLKEVHKEELERVSQLLDESIKELQLREEGFGGLKASKDLQNQAKAACCIDETNEDTMNLSPHKERLTKRYFSFSFAQSSLVHGHIDSCSQRDVSTDQSFELNSGMFGDEPLLSISNCAPKENSHVYNSSPRVPLADNSNAPWLNNSTSHPLEASNVSQQLFDGTDLQKELLYQQCDDLRQELAMKDQHLTVLNEEVIKMAEELKEARSRWAQVTEELMEARQELEEKDMRRYTEEEMNSETLKQDSLKNKLGAFLETKKTEVDVSPESSLLLVFSEGEGERVEELEEDQESSQSQQNQQEVREALQQEIKEMTEVNSQNDNQLQMLKANSDDLIMELEETKRKQQTTSTLLDKRTLEMDKALEDLQSTHAQLLTVQAEVESLQGELEKRQSSLQSAEKLRSDLEAKIICLEETRHLAVQEMEKHLRKEEEMGEQVKKIEQVLQEELKQFESTLQAKDVELAEEREKWENEKQEKDKELGDLREILEELRIEREEEVKALLDRQISAVEEATERLEARHQREMDHLMDKHQQEISKLNISFETKLQEQKVAVEQEQKQQLSLIKEVTEREHERMLSELKDQHDEALRQLNTELRESLEAAHQAELEQAQDQKNLELEALRLRLTNVHTSELVSQEAVTSAQASLREDFTQEIELLQAQYQLDLERIREQNQTQQDRLRELHHCDMELKQQFAEEKGFTEEKQTKEIQALRSDWLIKAESTQSTLQNNLTTTQTELAKAHETLKETKKSLVEAQECLTQTQTELQESKAQLKSLQTTSREQQQNLEEELKQAWADRDAAAHPLEELLSSHKALLQEKEQQVRHLQEKERQLQQEQVLQLQEQKDLLKKSSEEEVGQLWAQLDSMRASRQDLGELKEQLLARSSRVDDIERLKVEFNEQKREIKEQNEVELESLRRYFEQRLRVSDESYREEIALLQLRLVEVALEESVLKTTDSSFVSEGPTEEEEHGEQSDTNLKLEKQKEVFDTPLEEEFTVEQVPCDLTDHYDGELQKMKMCHSLDLQQLRAKLSGHHLQEVTRVQLETARQVEVEVEQRLWCFTEELHTRLTLIHTLENTVAIMDKQHNAELQKLKQEIAEERTCHKEALMREKKHALEEITSIQKELQEKNEAWSDFLKQLEEKTCLEKSLMEEKDELISLQTTLDNSEDSKDLKANNDVELQSEKNSMAKEMKELAVLLQQQADQSLKQAQDRFEEEKAMLEQCFSQKTEISLVELRNKHKTDLKQERATLLNEHSKEMDSLIMTHKAQLDSLCASHRDQLVAVTAELESKHNAQLVALEATLNSKRKEDLQALEAMFQETSNAQLEALEAELSRKHQEEMDEIENRMLANMETLEATYLREIQTLREEMVQMEQKHQALTSQKAEMVERHIAEQESIREELRKEMAQLHVNKFRAMAGELSHVHQAELSAQKESLDAEYCKALNELKAQVLQLEQQNSAAVQELTHTYVAEKEQLSQQHQLQLQELKAISARELEACRRELEEGSSRQRQHFLEEAELLKVQSGERLQDRINHLKADCEQQKEAELDDLRRAFASVQEEKERNYTNKMSQLTAQLQQLDAVVAQLRAEVGCLQGELQRKRAEMETLDTLLQKREREGQEGDNHLKMLTDDLHTAKEERRKLHQANDKLKKVLIEMLRSTIATEELIGQKISANMSTQSSHQRNSTGTIGAQEADVTSEDMELTELLCESLLVSDTQINPGGEEAAMNACSRLRQTVDTLLELLNQANTQLEQTYNIHVCLEEKLSQSQENSAQLVEEHKVLSEQIAHELKLKSQLELELHKAEGLLEGYVAEKTSLEEALLQKEAQEERLSKELEDLRWKVHQTDGLRTELNGIRAKHQELSEEHAALLRQKEHLSAGLGEREKALLAETERLTQDRLDLQRQAEKDRDSLSQRLRNLERELEEQETKGLEIEQYHKTHAEDLSQQVQALEKQLKHNRQFIEEQAVEREHERDEFQQEIRRLESQPRQMAGGDLKVHKFEDLVLQVENLQAIIKDKIEDHASSVEANQQAQRDVAERNEEIDKLFGRIRALEQELLNSAECNRSVGQLEQELHRAKLREEELTQDKQALEQQQLTNRLQISALQSKLDERRHCYHENTREPTQELRDALDAAQENLQSKEQEVEILLGQLDSVQRDLSIKEVELKHLTLQLEQLTCENAAQVHELQEQIENLKENVSTLAILAEEKRKVADLMEESLPSALLKDKNQEIDHLNNEIQRLELELENTRDNKDLEADLHDLSSQVEHLQSEITRLRQDRREEEERLHEVISTLQAELSKLSANVHEVSDSQDGDSINHSPAPSPEPHHFYLQELERHCEPHSLKQELGLTSSRTLRSRIKALQSQLETVVAEKESLERLLHTQENEYRGHGEEFGRRLTAEREKVDELQGLITLKEAELVEVKAQLEEAKEEQKICEDERNDFRLQAQQVQEEKMHLTAQFTALQEKEQNAVKETEVFKAKEQEIKNEMEALRERGLALEEQVKGLQADIKDSEEAFAKEAETLVTVRVELWAEIEVLKRKKGQLQEENERLRQDVASLQDQIEDLRVQLPERVKSQENAQKKVLKHSEVAVTEADAALRQRETELTGLRVENHALRAELTAVKHSLSSSTQRAEKLHEGEQNKNQALVNLENDNHLLKVELVRLQEDLALHEETLARQHKQLQQVRQQRHQRDTLAHHKGSSPNDISQRIFEAGVIFYRDDAELSSPEVVRHLERSEDVFRDQLHASVLGSHLSELSALNTTDVEHFRANKSPVVPMEPPFSRTITPDLATQSSHSPRSLSFSDNLDSVGASKVCDFEGHDLTAPPSLLGSTSSLSAPERASDGYGSNVSSELGARLRVELDQTERLDAQFVEYLRCRGMNPTANTDSAAGSMSYSDDLLSPELQAVLRKVYQESCRILTLSQRRPLSHVRALSAISHLHEDEGPTSLNQGDKSSSEPPMSWQQEKRALQETVIALRELLCRMAQRRTRTDSRSDGDIEQLQMESQTRAELLEESRKRLSCAHETQQEQKNKIQSLRLTIEECEEALKKEQTRAEELQQQLEQEQALSLWREKEVEQKIELMQTSSEEQKAEVMALKGQVEQERVTCSNLKRELQIEQSRSVLFEKHLDDLQKKLEEKRQQYAGQQELHLQEKSRMERLLTDLESRLSDVRSKLADAHGMLDEERDRCSKRLQEMSRKQEEDAARDGKFITDLRLQLEQKRRQGEELAAEVEKLKAELLQNRRQWEEDMSREEAATRHRVAAQKQDADRALEVERERSRRQGAELAELKERIQLLKDNEKEREEEWEREKRKGWQEQREREGRQERTNNKLRDYELLRQQDKQRMDELQRTLTELQREERQVTAQRMSALSGERHQTDAANDGSSLQSQILSVTSPSLLERTISKNSELTQRVTSLSQERTALKHKLSYLEHQLRRAEGELANVAVKSKNIAIGDVTQSNKLQRLYGRYLRAERFRNSLVYQKRYLLLLLGGFQEGEQATLCLIARMGGWPSPLPSSRTPLRRFRTAVRVVIAISRMKFLIRKWQRLSGCGNVNGHAAGFKAEVLRQQQPRSNSESPPKRDAVSALVPPNKSPVRLRNRSLSSSTLTSDATSQDPERALTEYIQELEKFQQRLVGSKPGSSLLQHDPKKSDH